MNSIQFNKGIDSPRELQKGARMAMEVLPAKDPFANSRALYLNSAGLKTAKRIVYKKLFKSSPRSIEFLLPQYEQACLPVNAKGKLNGGLALQKNSHGHSSANGRLCKY